MIFSSKNEEGKLKADWMSSLPIGATAITRRSIKPNDKCSNCDFEFWKHSPDVRGKLKYSFPKATKEEIEKQGWKVNGETVQRSCHSFFPAKFKIGKQIKIQKKRCGSAICADCKLGKNEFPHGYKCIDGLHSLPDRILKIDEIPECVFKPILYKVEAGEWHKEWETEAHMDDDGLNVEYEFENEAKLEFFKTVKGWLDYYPAHNIKIEDTWRVELERIQ